MNRSALRFFSLTLLFTTALFLAACGKAGMPVPKKTQDTFAITGANVTVMGKCLAARGTATGATNNVEKLMIEVDPIQSYDDCPGCPFSPSDYQEFSASEAEFDTKTGQFLLSFCPSVEAPMYRWRLVGKNVFPGLPYATTTPQVVIMNK